MMGPGPPGHRREPTLDEPLNPPFATDVPPAVGDAPSRPPRTGSGSARPDEAEGPGSPPPPPPRAPGLFEQIRSTKDAGRELLGSHIELAKAELSEIADAAKRAAIFVGIALGAGLVAGLLLIVGLPLFLGEALFGSMGWGILLGVLFLAAVALAGAVLALRPGVDASIGRPFLLALIIGVIVGILLGLDLTNRAWSAVADAVVPTLDPAWRPLLVAVVALAVIGAIVGLVLAAMSGAGGGAILGGVVGGAVAGILLGWLTAFAPGPRVGAAIGVAVGLIAWIALMAAGLARGGFDTEAIKRRFLPDRTIETAKETLAWARSRIPGSTTPTPGS
jgi:hypothetical protein